MTDLPAKLRAVIAVDKGLEPGAVANASAIVMGQLARLSDDLYTDDVRDADAVRHAGIRFNTVVLSGRSSHLTRLVEESMAHGIEPVLFTTRGRDLSNSPEEYRELVAGGSAEDLGLCAVGVVGAHEVVRALTKRFSVYS